MMSSVIGGAMLLLTAPGTQPGTPARKLGFLTHEDKVARETDLYGAFPVKWCFRFIASSLFGAGRPFFVPSPAIRFAERAEGVKGPKR